MTEDMSSSSPLLGQGDMARALNLVWDLHVALSLVDAEALVAAATSVCVP